MTLTHGELFAGISGFGLGFAQAGIETLWHVEIDEKCQSVLRSHYPGTLLLSDVRDCGAHNLPPVDIISFGSPCQDLSIAGKRKGLIDGEKSNLFFEAVRIVDELKPTFAVWENVPGAFSANSGRDFATVLASFRDIGARDIAWTVLDAQYFALAQRRRRVFLVADFTGERAGTILFESSRSAWDPPPSREAGTKAAVSFTERTRGDSRQLEWTDGPAYSLDNPGNGGRSQTRLVAFGGNDTSGPVDIATACNAHPSRRYDFESETFIAAHCTGPGWWNQAEIAGTLRAEGENRPSRPSNIVAFDRTRSTTSGDIAGTLRACGAATPGVNDGKADAQCVAFDWQNGSKSERTRIVRSGEYAQITGTHVDAISTGYGVRRLTPTEAARLQGFSDDWNAQGVDAQGATIAMSDSARYRQLGNAVAVPCAQWLGRRILEAL